MITKECYLRKLEITRGFNAPCIVLIIGKVLLDGMSLCASAEKVGLKLPASSVSRILQNRRYLGDDFYPPLIDEETYSRTLQERERRMKVLSRTNLLKPKVLKTAPAEFFFSDKDSLHKGTPAEVAEYQYSLIRVKEKTNG